ncbi:hypothetical protein GCM10008090_19370 [Arenicella chitinivorans]|uniref:Uncharacterized protein n=1 Tax=Arenicella chitinivorans TaxID=1329800 RepID=A0A918VKT0_9GAMM|nr:hypothetical protein [Arenicella chitinivorans]GHA09474.1 hypothetical protein GCM10008090_19370 [Arenicella chitinivorans]
MEIIIFHRLYNTYGGHRSFTLAGEYLEYGMPEFGDAVDELEITLHFFQDGPAKKTLEQSHEDFHNNLECLPKCTFYRKKRRLALDFEAKFTTGYEIQKYKKPPIEIIPDWVRSTLDELIGQLPLIKSKIKKNDNFDFVSFEKYVSQKRNELPMDVAELEKFEELFEEYRKQEAEKLDDWERLRIDWEDYHPKAKEIIPIPSLWSCTDEFSPNGNDTGADTLEIFRKWNKRNSNNDALFFLTQLLKDWEIDIDAPYESEYSSYTYFQCVTGLAFASAKLRGNCEQDLKDKAVSAINEYLASIENADGWEYKDECKEKLNLSKEAIEKMPNK